MLFSLRSRLMAVFSVLLILPFALLAYILSRESTDIIKASIESSTAQTIEQYASHVTTLLAQVEDAGNQALSDRITQEWLAVQLNPDSTVRERVASKQRLREYYSSFGANNSSGIAISAFTGEAGGIWTQDQTYKNSEWFHAFTAEGIRWTTAHKDPDQADEIMRSRPVNSFIFPLVQLQSLRNAGLIKVSYPTALLRDPIEKISIGRTGKVVLLTREGKSVLNQDITEDGEDWEAALRQIDTNHPEEENGIFPVQRGGRRICSFSASFLRRAGSSRALFPKGSFTRRLPISAKRCSSSALSC
ncbi:hypothetical protein LJK88_18815 [Paenibacillus sp. P26]|nr:hypothetical protein LJK88_18815 [Paenibacillus sp. P26]UUZ96226.1 hypothetical protein LJK87_18995 [Paenibacillus sp. P25]